MDTASLVPTTAKTTLFWDSWPVLLECYAQYQGSIVISALHQDRLKYRAITTARRYPALYPTTRHTALHVPRIWIHNKTSYLLPSVLTGK